MIFFIDESALVIAVFSSLSLIWHPASNTESATNCPMNIYDWILCLISPPVHEGPAAGGPHLSPVSPGMTAREIPG